MSNILSCHNIDFPWSFDLDIFNFDSIFNLRSQLTSDFRWDLLESFFESAVIYIILLRHHEKVTHLGTLIHKKLLCHWLH